MCPPPHTHTVFCVHPNNHIHLRLSRIQVTAQHLTCSILRQKKMQKGTDICYYEPIAELLIFGTVSKIYFKKFIF
jgi:hypothetical protein